MSYICLYTQQWE